MLSNNKKNYKSNNKKNSNNIPETIFDMHYQDIMGGGVNRYLPISATTWDIDPLQFQFPIHIVVILLLQI